MGAGPAGGGAAGSSGSGGAAAATGAANADGATGDAGVPDTDLVALAEHVGQTVRVGGLVQELAADGFVLDDGTAIGRVVLTGDAAAYLPMLELGDALNATGRVELDGEEPRVVVADSAGLVLVGDLAGATQGPAGASQSGSALDDGRPAPRRLAGGLLGPLEPGTAGAGIVLVTALSLAVTALRRRRSRRLLAARIGARLAGLAASPAAGPPA
jgi:hypothetical protein